MECLQKESAKVGSFFGFIEEKENVGKCGKSKFCTTTKSVKNHKTLYIFTKYMDLTLEKYSDNMQTQTKNHTNKQNRKCNCLKWEERKWQKQML